MVDLVSIATKGQQTSAGSKAAALGSIGIERTSTGQLQGVSQRVTTPTTKRRRRSSRKSSSSSSSLPVSSIATPSPIISSPRPQAKTLASQLQSSQTSSRSTPSQSATTLSRQQDLVDIGRRSTAIPVRTPTRSERVRGGISSVLRFPEEKVIQPALQKVRGSTVIQAADISRRSLGGAPISTATTLDLGSFIVPGIAPVRATTFTAGVAGEIIRDPGFIKEKPLEVGAAALIGGGAALKIARRATAPAIQSNVGRQIGLNLESLGESRLGGIRTFETKAGQFGLAAEQKAGALTRDIIIRGTPQRISESFSIIPSAKGTAETLGIFKPSFTTGVLPKTRTAVARALSSPTEFRALQEFTVDAASFGRTGKPIAGGVIPARSSGIGVFTPGRQISGTVKRGVADFKLLPEGQIVTAPTKTTSFAQQLDKGTFGISVSPKSTILDVGIKTSSKKAISEASKALGSDSRAITKAITQKQLTGDIGQIAETTQSGLKQQRVVNTVRAPRASSGSRSLPKQTVSAPSRLTKSVRTQSVLPQLGTRAAIGGIAISRTISGSISSQLPSSRSLQSQSQDQFTSQREIVSTKEIFSPRTISSGSPISPSPASPLSFTGGGISPLSPAGAIGAIGLPRLPSLRGTSGNQLGGGSFTQRIRPSLTGISVFQLAGITGDLPKTGGISTRFVPKEFASTQKRSRKTSKKLTDF